jgi:hypothetical protein
MGSLPHGTWAIGRLDRSELVAPLINAGLLLCVGAPRLDSSGQCDPNSVVMGAPKNGGLLTKSGKPARFRVYGTRDGLQIKVVVEPGGEGIITAFPWPGAPT